MKNENSKKIISALIMLPLLIFLVIGKIPLLVFCLVISCLCMYEFYKGFEVLDLKPNMISGFCCVLLLYAIIYVDKIHGAGVPASQDLMFLWVFVTIISCLLPALLSKGHNILPGMITLMGVLYPGFMMAHLAMIKCIEGYSMMVWIAAICAVGTDIFAYFAGIFFGQHALCPQISPKKTVEGAIGGLIASTILCFLFGIIFVKGLGAKGLIIGLLGSVAAQLGDLTASAFKRKFGIKDYSNIIPGHGGFLDRFDSLLFAAPFVYYVTVMVLK